MSSVSAGLPRTQRPENKQHKGDESDHHGRQCDRQSQLNVRDAQPDHDTNGSRHETSQPLCQFANGCANARSRGERCPATSAAGFKIEKVSKKHQQYHEAHAIVGSRVGAIKYRRDRAQGSGDGNQLHCGIFIRSPMCDRPTDNAPFSPILMAPAPPDLPQYVTK